MKALIRTMVITLLLVVGNVLYSGMACTRVMYKGLGNLIITARSMDWSEDIYPNLWLFPRGMNRDGALGPASVKWKSRYGSVVCSAYDFASTDGMNEKGLVVNLLWLAESQYPQWDGKTPGLSISAWTQYVLDNFATVGEAVDELQQEKFTVVTDKVPGQDRLANLHLSISDARGDNAILEYLDGKLVIHHGEQYVVMTNSPVYDQQLTLNEYWKEIGGTVMLPGTNRAADRFVRASFYTDAIPKTDDMKLGAAYAFSVIRNCSVPLGISTPGHPNISSTRWRSVSDQRDLVYFFETTTTPNVVWVPLKDVDFSGGAAVKKLALSHGEVYEGNAVKSFVETKPFEFLGLHS
jgi:penicillin V acylase-like amidase (Ntn superfamily)